MRVAEDAQTKNIAERRWSFGKMSEIANNNWSLQFMSKLMNNIDIYCLKANQSHKLKSMKVN
jgi:hypothetical protein